MVPGVGKSCCTLSNNSPEKILTVAETVESNMEHADDRITLNNSGRKDCLLETVSAVLIKTRKNHLLVPGKSLTSYPWPLFCWLPSSLARQYMTISGIRLRRLAFSTPRLMG
jgi:hypothetical protein